MSVLNSECAGELLGSASNLIMHSGNIASWSKLRKKGVLTSTDELVSVTEASFRSWLGRQNQNNESENSYVYVRNAGLCRPITESEKADYIFTLKIFMAHWGTSKDVQEAVQLTLTELGLSNVDAIIVAFPVCQTSEHTLEKMRPIWEGMEGLVRSGIVKDVGTADLDKKQFEELYNWATVKPDVNQVNLAHCCTMPEDLVEYAKLHNVRLMTHNDERDIFPLSHLQSALDSTLDGCVDHTHWKPQWVTKYSSIIRLRGIIAHKGYVVNLATEHSLAQ